MKKFNIGIKLWFETEDREGFFGGGKLKLLTEIETRGSLSAAAEMLDMSYRKAWGDLKKAEKGFGVKLVMKSRGGRNGGSTILTENGRDLLNAYKRCEISIRGFAETFFEREVRSKRGEG